MYIWPILQAWSSYDEASQILEREPCPATHSRAHPCGSEVSLALSFSQAVHRVLLPLSHRRCNSFILHQILSFFYLWCSSAVRSIWQLYVMGKKKKDQKLAALHWKCFILSHSEVLWEKREIFPCEKAAVNILGDKSLCTINDFLIILCFSSLLPSIQHG